ncbi:DUF7507 domain-containing protein, partial [Mongoliibacter ruber]|uniref:DUF7507 domain-containing protein n=1 Tax=Mongoliibacter ruber TaxID=1750599 RepID=UPI0011B26441
YTVAANAPCTEEAVSVVTVVVVDSPDAGENGTLTICEGEEVTTTMLFASLGGTPDADGTWNDNGDGTWTYTVAANAPCTEVASSVVFVNTIQVSAPEGNDLTICSDFGDVLTARATVPEGFSVVWFNEFDEVVENPTLSGIGSITYFAEAVNNETGCVSINRTPITLTINSCKVDIVKEVDQSQIDGPLTLNYTITISNAGNIPLTNVVVTDPLTNGDEVLTLVSGDLNEDGNLDINERWVYITTFEVTQEMIDLGLDITNTAFVNSDQTTVKESTANTKIDQNPLLSVVKTATSINGDAMATSFSVVGDEISYTIIVSNTGNVTLSNVVVTDPLTGFIETIEGLAAGESKTFTTSYTVTQADVDAGRVLNVASATGKDPDGEPTLPSTDEVEVLLDSNDIEANDDDFGPINGTTGGTVPGNVLDNDTLNGDPVNPDDVILTPINVDPNSPVVINPDGTVTVAPNTPAGDYEVEYSICEVLNPGNCDTATVTVTVTAPRIIANDDDYGVHPVDFGGVLGNIL